MGFANGERFCDIDADCGLKQYCYSTSRSCVDYVVCSRYKRDEGVQPARSPSECGSCFKGFKAEVYIDGGESESCGIPLGFDKTQGKNGGFYMDNRLLLWGSLVTFAVIAVFITVFIKRRAIARCKSSTKWPDVCMPFKPSAPPLEENLFISAEDNKWNCMYNNNNLKDKNTLVSAIPFKDPSWVKSNPSYEQQLAAETVDANNHVIPMGAMQADEDTNPSSWTPEESVSIHVPNRPFVQFSTEPREPGVATVSVQGNCPSESASGTQSGPHNNNGSNMRQSNILINQITMNLNVVNENC